MEVDLLLVCRKSICGVTPLPILHLCCYQVLGRGSPETNGKLRFEFGSTF